VPGKLGLVVDRQQAFLGLAEDIDVGKRPALAHAYGAQDLIGRSARIGLAVRHARKFRRQLGAEPCPEDGHDDVAVRCFRYLRLESRVRGIERRFPTDGLNPRNARKLAIEAFSHVLDTAPFMVHVAG